VRVVCIGVLLFVKNIRFHAPRVIVSRVCGSVSPSMNTDITDLV
jgi:hypothetical protein